MSGEEVTTDYALWQLDEHFISSWICHCGAAYCRGRVTGNDWKSQVLQQRYDCYTTLELIKRTLITTIIILV
ncbi:MAG: hypothetical protein APR63_05255 [Desulfuromonas sp. SDB]|nr:MAG: hypothetical protein APR63_05255 [Desulfuromonas sp. SDB]